jgi:outer membrane protein
MRDFPPGMAPSRLASVREGALPASSARRASLSLPIFNNLSVKSSVSNAEIGLENARLVAINEKNQLRQTIEQAYANAKASSTTYFARERQVEALQQSFTNTEIRYNLGAVNALEYSQAQNNLNAAQSDLIRAKYDYIFSLKVLDFYEGKPLDFN